jgi:hypothetical protein
VIVFFFSSSAYLCGFQQGPDDFVDDFRFAIDGLGFSHEVDESLLAFGYFFVPVLDLLYQWIDLLDAVVLMLLVFLALIFVRTVVLLIIIIELVLTVILFFFLMNCSRIFTVPHVRSLSNS